MDALYHKTNQTILEIGDCFQKLIHFKQSNADTSIIENEIQEKIQFVKSNCDRLDILVLKEPVTKRPSSKMKVDQLKYDNMHFQSALQRHQNDKIRRINEEREREELLSKRFTQNKLQDDTAIYIDYSLQHQKSLQNSNRGVDDLISSGSSILDNLREQRETLKGAHRRIMDIGNTLGLSNTTMRYIEKRAREDKYILIVGIVITVIVLIFIIFYVL